MKRECAIYWGNEGGGNATSFPLQRWRPEAAMVVARGRLAAAVPACFSVGRMKEADGAGWAKRLSGSAGCWANWARS
jgi:hypothetical protein